MNAFERLCCENADQAKIIEALRRDNATLLRQIDSLQTKLSDLRWAHRDPQYGHAW